MTWENMKNWMLGLAGVILMTVSAVSFTFGLSFESKVPWMIYVGAAVWLATTMVQIAGTGKFKQSDLVMQIIIVASYALGVSVGTYAWTLVLDFGDLWIVSFVASLSFASFVEFAPERLLNIVFADGKRKSVSVQSTPTLFKDEPKKPVAPPSKPNSTQFNNRQQNNAQPSYWQSKTKFDE